MTVAGRVGEAFGVIEAPSWLAVSATRRPELRRRLCPTSIAPSGVRLLVEAGASFRDELARVRGIRLAESGSLVRLPPTLLLAGRVRWWITPEQVDWRLGDGAAIQDALCAALTEDTRSGGAGA